ncbi:MAG TPA: chemotaxis response regulator protein-glutamate methylesterase [Methylococcaceae bacterium]|nr:chemotaxis response regulator protein-glutamate methylesterase [Methylococcaceae bacterium]
MAKIRLLIIDDSALIRKMLTEIFNISDDIEVVGTAADPIIARDKIKKLKPDVLTLDIEMPRMDGLTFLRNLMRLRPLPVVMVSTLTEKGAAVTLEALELGAIDFVAKPKMDVSNTLNEYAEDIIAKVKVAAKAHVRGLPFKPKPKPVFKVSEASEKHTADVILSAVTARKHFKTTDMIIALGASTGGTEAIKTVVRNLPNTTPAIVISQHLPAAFSASFASHVNHVSAMKCCIAQNYQQILPGNIYIAPGDMHLIVIRDGARYICQLNDGPPVNRHKPAVDVMFRSVAQNVGSNAIGIMLTGMGADGAKGMKEMKDAGAINIIQDEASSVVWGMPGEAFKLGGVDYVVSLDDVAAKILTQVK